MLLRSVIPYPILGDGNEGIEEKSKNGIRWSLILNKSAPVHWYLKDLPKTISCSADLLMGV